MPLTIAAHCVESITTDGLSWLQHQLLEMAANDQYKEAITAWCQRLEQEMLTLRDIEPRIRIIDGEGEIFQVPQHLLQRATDIVDRYPITFGKDGRQEIRITDYIEKDLISPEERARMFDEYGEEQVKQEHFVKGVAKGIEKEKVEIAKEMLQQGMAISLISQITKLSEEAITHLKNENSIA